MPFPLSHALTFPYNAQQSHYVRMVKTGQNLNFLFKVQLSLQAEATLKHLDGHHQWPTLSQARLSDLTIAHHRGGGPSVLALVHLAKATLTNLLQKRNLIAWYFNLTDQLTQIVTRMVVGIGHVLLNTFGQGALGRGLTVRA